LLDTKLTRTTMAFAATDTIIEANTIEVHAIYEISEAAAHSSTGGC